MHTLHICIFMRAISTLRISLKQLQLASPEDGLCAPRHSSTLAVSCLLFQQLLTQRDHSYLQLMSAASGMKERQTTVLGRVPSVAG